MAKLGDCGRCMPQHPATTVQQISFGDSSYELRLCERQADNLLRDLFGWARVGTILEPEDKATFKPKSQPAPRQRGGTLVASHMHVPTQVIEPVEELPALPMPIPRKPRIDPSLPINQDRWVWSDHAIQRARLRRLTSEDVLWCAEHPDTVRPGRTADTLVHIRGHVKVVVDPTTHQILTVSDRRDDDERDLQNAC